MVCSMLHRRHKASACQRQQIAEGHNWTDYRQKATDKPVVGSMVRSAWISQESSE